MAGNVLAAWLSRRHRHDHRELFSAGSPASRRQMPLDETGRLIAVPCTGERGAHADRVQRLPLLRAVLPGVSSDGGAHSFAPADLAYLANLCHNCGECLYACQYAPPHEFGINVPRTLAEIRVASYEAYAWPRGPGHGVSPSLGADSGGAGHRLQRGDVARGAADRLAGAAAGRATSTPSCPHGAMVALFGGVFAFAVIAIASACAVRARRGGDVIREPAD
jgi:hypothetical protein